MKAMKKPNVKFEMKVDKLCLSIYIVYMYQSPCLQKTFKDEYPGIFLRQALLHRVINLNDYK